MQKIYSWRDCQPDNVNIALVGQVLVHDYVIFCLHGSHKMALRPYFLPDTAPVPILRSIRVGRVR